MADTTISALTPGIPAGNNMVPYSTGSVTLGAPVSDLFRNSLLTVGGASNDGNYVSSFTQLGQNGVFVWHDNAIKSLTATGLSVAINRAEYPAAYLTNAAGNALIVDAGNVGIGTLTPSSKLEVNGTIKATALQVPGCLLQVVQTLRTDIRTTASTAYIDATGYTITITPKSTSSKILVSVNCAAGGTAAHAIWVKLLRGGTTVASFNNYSGGVSNATYMVLPIVMEYLDTTVLTDVSPVTYKLMFRSDDASSTVSIGGPLNNAYGQGTAIWTNTITCKEIAG